MTQEGAYSALVADNGVGIGPALAALRERSEPKLTQRAVAERLDVRHTSVAALEARGANPQAGTLLAYLAAIGCTLHDLAEALDERQPTGEPRQRKGRPSPHRVAAMVAFGRLDGDVLRGWIADALADEQTADQELADLSASVAAMSMALWARLGTAERSGGSPRIP